MSEAVVDTIDALVVVVGPDGVIQLFNSACEELSGRRAEEMIGQSVFDGLIPEDQLEEVGAVFARLVAGERRVDHENDWLAASGERHRIAWRNTSLVDAAGRVTHVIATGLDVSARVELRRRLALVSDELKGALAAFGDRIFIFDAEGTVLEVAANADTEWFVDRSTLVGRRMRDVFPGGLGEEYEAAIARSIDDAETSTIEYELPFPRGERHFEARIAPLRDGDVLAVVRDVTATVELSQGLTESRLTATLGRMASGIAHDINNLLAAVGMNLDALEHDVAGQPAPQQRIERMRRVIDRSTRLVDDLFTLAQGHRATATTFSLCTAILDLEPVLREVCGTDRALTIQCDDEAVVLFNERALDQILLNLVTNARDATTQDGSITIRVTQDRVAEAMATVTVTDDGGGMEPAVAAQAFEPFFTTKGPGRSGGLGLATTAALVRQLGGQIKLSSTPGHGTTVTVSLPLAPALDAPPGNPGVVLVLDDDAEMAALVGEMLAAEGIPNERTTGLPEALARIDAAWPPIRLIVTDLILDPGFGTDLLPELEARQLQVPVLFLTGSRDPAVLDRVPASHVLLPKPFARAELLSTLTNLLDGAKR